jgi:hypothetical protein
LDTLALSHHESNIFVQGVLFFSIINLFKYLGLLIAVNSQDAHAQIIIIS